MAGDFPSWRYGPNGEEAIFDCADDVPAGWHDHPCKCKPKGGDPAVSAGEAIVDAVADMAEQIAKFDGDGDGRIGGSKAKPRRKVNRRGPRK